VGLGTGAFRRYGLSYLWSHLLEYLGWAIQNLLRMFSGIGFMFGEFKQRIFSRKLFLPSFSQFTLRLTSREKRGFRIFIGMDGEFSQTNQRKLEQNEQWRDGWKWSYPLKVQRGKLMCSTYCVNLNSFLTFPKRKI